MAVPDIRLSMARCSRASLNLLAANNGLIVGENYLITSETPNVHCVATSVSTYNEYYSKADADTKFSLPIQTGNSGKYLTTNGSVTSWASINSAPKSILILDSSGETEVDLSTGDYFRIETYKANPTDSCSLRFKNYDGREKKITIVNAGAYALDLNIIFSQFVESSPNFTMSFTAYSQNTTSQYYDCATRDLTIYGEQWARMTRVSEASTTRIYYPAVTPPTDLQRLYRTNNSLTVSWRATPYVPCMLLAVQAATFPTIDVNAIDPAALTFSGDWANASTVQGVKCIYYGTDLDPRTLLTGLGAYKAYSFSLYSYRRKISHLSPYGFSTAVQMLNQKTLF